MRSPELTEAAGHAFLSITGANLTLGDQQSTLSRIQNAAPSPDTAEHWWQLHQERFTSGVRYLEGQPLTTEHCTGYAKSQPEQPCVPAPNATDSVPETPDFLVDALRTSTQKLRAPAVRLNNTSPFPAATVFWQDADGSLKLTVIVKATFELDEQQTPRLTQNQWPILSVCTRSRSGCGNCDHGLIIKQRIQCHRQICQ